MFCCAGCGHPREELPGGGVALNLGSGQSTQERVPGSRQPWGKGQATARLHPCIQTAEGGQEHGRGGPSHPPLEHRGVMDSSFRDQLDFHLAAWTLVPHQLGWKNTQGAPRRSNKAHRNREGMGPTGPLWAVWQCQVALCMNLKPSDKKLLNIPHVMKITTTGIQEGPQTQRTEPWGTSEQGAKSNGWKPKWGIF